MCAKVLFHRCQTLENNGVLLVPRSKDYGLASFFLPLLDDLRIACYFDRSPIILKGHAPVKSLFVQRSESWLKGVIVRRSQKLPRQCAAGNRREATPDRFLFDNLSFVVLVFLLGERIPLKRGWVHRYYPVISKLIDHRMIIQRSHADPMPLRSFQKHASEAKKGIGDVALLDLLNYF
jgi:hypothetical protein